MIKITFRYKVALELYASLSLFFVIIILLYYYISDKIRESLFFPVVGMIGLFLIGFIFFMRTLILDVDSVKFESEETRDEPNIVEIKLINKVALEIISSVSNLIIIVLIFLFGFEKSGWIDLEALSMIFIVVLSLPLLILLKSLILDFNLILMNKRHRENFLSELINRKTLVFFIIAILILFSIIASNKMVTSVDNLYDKSMSTGEDTISDISSNLYITSIEGDRTSDGPVTSLTIYLESMNLDFNFKYITVKLQDKTNISTLKYGQKADESHFYFEGKLTGKGKSILKKGDEGFIKINLSSTKQELYSYDRETIQLDMGNGKIISRDIKTPELNEDTRILLYPTR
jgi:archaellin